jgi:hypothetical protein
MGQHNLTVCQQGHDKTNGVQGCAHQIQRLTPEASRETRQQIRLRLRIQLGDAPGKQEYRRFRGLPELNDRESFKPHLVSPIGGQP